MNKYRWIFDEIYNKKKIHGIGILAMPVPAKYIRYYLYFLFDKAKRRLKNTLSVVQKP